MLARRSAPRVVTARASTGRPVAPTSAEWSAVRRGSRSSTSSGISLAAMAASHSRPPAGRHGDDPGSGQDRAAGRRIEVGQERGVAVMDGRARIEGLRVRMETLWTNRLRALKGLYRGPEHEDEMVGVGYLPHATVGLNPHSARSVPTTSSARKSRRSWCREMVTRMRLSPRGRRPWPTAGCATPAITSSACVPTRPPCATRTRGSS